MQPAQAQVLQPARVLQVPPAAVGTHPLEQGGPQLGCPPQQLPADCPPLLSRMPLGAGQGPPPLAAHAVPVAVPLLAAATVTQQRPPYHPAPKAAKAAAATVQQALLELGPAARGVKRPRGAAAGSDETDPGNFSLGHPNGSGAGGPALGHLDGSGAALGHLDGSGAGGPALGHLDGSGAGGAASVLLNGGGASAGPTGGWDAESTMLLLQAIMM